MFMLQYGYDMTSVKITITVPLAVLDSIDRVRGLIPLSTFISDYLVTNIRKESLK